MGFKTRHLDLGVHMYMDVHMLSVSYMLMPMLLAEPAPNGDIHGGEVTH